MFSKIEQTTKPTLPGAPVNDFSPEHKARAINAAAADLLPKLTKGSLNSDDLKTSMNASFKGSDAEGFWDWKAAYEALEVTQILFLRRYGQAILNRGPQKTLSMLEKLTSSLPTHTRRNEEMIEFQQFSTPLPLSFIAGYAANLTVQDVLLEPSAGTGMLALFGELAGSSLVLNELADTRFTLLKTIFPQASVTSFNAEQLHDRLSDDYKPSVIIMNPPFSAAANLSKNDTSVTLQHLKSALNRLSNGGRLVLITGENFKPAGKWLNDFNKIQKQATLVFSCALPGSVFYKHGTSFDTRISVFDKTVSEGSLPTDGMYSGVLSSLTEMLALLDERLPERQTCFGCNFPGKIEVDPGTVKSLKREIIEAPVNKGPLVPQIELLFEQNSKPENSSGSTSSFVPWVPSSFKVKDSKPHVSLLCQSAAMASVVSPKPVYRPRLRNRLIRDGILSEAQLETIVYAGEAHSDFINAWCSVNEDGVTVRAAKKEDETATQFRRGYFLGDGTGAGKGRQIAGVFLDNWNNGRKRGIWISGSSALLEDARRDWAALGGDETQIVPIDRFKAGVDIKLPEGILFTTFATLRSEGKKQSRIEQIFKWCGTDFSGVIAFDEAHSMANAIVKENQIGQGKASQQGLAGLRLQFGLPDARILYASATAGSDVTDLGYAERLGIWGAEDMPFNTRDDFISAMTEGGIAAMEMIARDLKSMGLYTSRVLSYEGVEVNPLLIDLSPEQTDVYNTYADAFAVMHQNLESVLSLLQVDGKHGRQVKAAAMSRFEGTKQRFFNALLTGMSGPKLIKELEADIEAGRAPVLQLVSTSEALLDRRLDEVPKSQWNDLQVDFTPRDMIVSFLEASFPIQLYEEYEVNGEVHLRAAKDDQGNLIVSKEAVRMREDLIEKISYLPSIPTALDQVLHHFGEDVVAEVTGRKKRVLYRDDRFYIGKRTATSNITETQAFLDDKKKILVFSNAGGTGRSYHADLNFINQRQRVHYLVEAGWQADKAVQGLGRSKRTNQAQEPIFRFVSTNVKGQRRFISTIARRLDALGAITRGQREGDAGSLFTEDDNLESDYARQALYSFYKLLYNRKLNCCDIDEFQDLTGLKLKHPEGGLNENLPPIQRFLNRLLALRIDMQNRIFEDFDKLHHGIIERAKEAGEYQIGVEELRADSLIELERKVIYTSDQGGESLLVKVERRDKRYIADVDELLGRPEAKMFWNSRSKRSAVRLPTTSYLDDEGILIERYKLVRPATEEVVLVKDFDETAWEQVPADKFLSHWKHEVSDLPEYHTMSFYLITGLLLPLWRYLSKDNPKVRRLVLDNGERLLGRVVNAGELSSLLGSLGVDNKVEISSEELWQHINKKDGHAQLSENLKLRRSLVSGDYRCELIGVTYQNKDRIKSLGCMTEFIQSRARVFIPNDKVLKNVTEAFKLLTLT